VTRRHAIRAGAATTAVALLLTGCAETVERERRALVDATWRETVTLADQAVSALLDLHPELTLTEVDGDFTGEDWSDCSRSITGNAVSPTEIMWSSRRDVQVDPSRETASLADDLAEWLVAQGWEQGEARSHEGGHRNGLFRDSYGITLLSTTETPTDRLPTIQLLVYSPCIRAPERMLDWATPAPTPTPP
jgi:hypothetical protein